MWVRRSSMWSAVATIHARHVVVSPPRERAHGGWSKKTPPRLSVASFEFAARAAALLGIVRLPLYFARGHLAKKQLVPVLEPWTLPAIEVYAVYRWEAPAFPRRASSWITSRNGSEKTRLALKPPPLILGLLDERRPGRRLPVAFVADR